MECAAAASINILFMRPFINICCWSEGMADPGGNEGKPGKIELAGGSRLLLLFVVVVAVVVVGNDDDDDDDDDDCRSAMSRNCLSAELEGEFATESNEDAVLLFLFEAGEDLDDDCIELRIGGLNILELGC